MVLNTQTNRRAPRLNPFIFPSDTDLRFVLLIVAVLGASLYMYSTLYFAINFNYASISEKYCILFAQVVHSADPEAQRIASGNCLSPLTLTQTWWISLGIALQLSVAGVIYWALPTWKIWRGKLKQMSADKDLSDVVTYLSDLCREANLSRDPIFLLEPRFGRSNPVTFGRLGRYYVRMNLTFVNQFCTKIHRPAFRGIILHELGHIRNADVDKTYLTISIGWAFGIAAFAPWLVYWLYPSVVPFILFPLKFLSLLNYLVLHFPTGFYFKQVWQVPVFAILIYLTRSAILRARELYADTRASVWDGQAGALDHALQTLSKEKGWLRFLHYHPNPEERRRVLHDTFSLFQIGFWDAFATGIAVAGILSNVYWLIISPLSGGGQVLGASGLETWIVFAPLIVGIIGLGVWRATFANKVQGKAVPSTTRISVGLALGLLIGQTLSPYMTNAYSGYFTDVGFLTAGQSTLSSFLSQAGFFLLWSVLLLFMLFFFFQWIVACAATWMDVTTNDRSIRRTCWLTLATASVILGIWCGQFLYLRTIAEQLLSALNWQTIISDMFFVTTIFAADPRNLIAFACLWAYPLAAWFWRKRTTPIRNASWVFLDAPPQPQPMAPSHQAPLRPDLALISALAGGMIFWGMLVLLVSGFHTDIFASGPLRWQPQPAIELAVLVQAVTAGIVAYMVRPLSSLHGLFAAFIAGCIMTVEIVVFRLPASISLVGPWPSFIWITFRLIVNGGSLLALPVAWALSILARWIRRSSRHHALTSETQGILHL